jgi:hypothetical protein
MDKFRSGLFGKRFLPGMTPRIRTPATGSMKTGGAAVRRSGTTSASAPATGSSTFGEPPDSCFEDAYDFEHQPGQLRMVGPPGFREP